MKMICKITRTDGQTRITIPKMLVEETEMNDIDYVILQSTEPRQIMIRRVIDEREHKA